MRERIFVRSTGQNEVEHTALCGHATHTDTKPIDTQHASLLREGDFFLYKLGPVETLTTPFYTITADYEDKELILDRMRDNPVKKLFGLDLTTALDACESVLVSSPRPGFRLIRLDVPSPDVERVDLLFNALSRKMQQVTLYYSQPEEWVADQSATQARMEIIYRTQEERPVFAKGLFLLERFAQQVNGVFEPVAGFKDFEFYDNSGY